jgi:hypothetical protein
MEIKKQLHGIDAFTRALDYALDPTEMEREILQENRLHDEIDKTIKRLAQVKGYKQLGLVARLDANTSKLIEVSPSKTIENARQPNNENSPQLAQEMAKLAKRKD